MRPGAAKLPPEPQRRQGAQRPAAQPSFHTGPNGHDRWHRAAAEVCHAEFAAPVSHSVEAVGQYTPPIYLAEPSVQPSSPAPAQRAPVDLQNIRPTTQSL